MSVVTPTILSSDGKLMDPSYEWVSLDVSQEVNRISYAQLVLLDGDAARQEFPISDSDFFEPGKKIEIKLRYEDAPDQEVTVFKGIVIKQNVETSLAGSLLTVELKDEAIKLTRTRKSQIYRDQTDDKIIGQIIDDSGLTKGTIPATQAQHLELVQYYCSDWDFIRSRAESLGLLITTTDGEIALAEITLEKEPKHTFEYGVDIFNFEMEVNAEQQYPSVQSTAWDIKNQELTKPAEAKNFTLSQGNLPGADIAKAIGIESHILNNPVSLEAEELQAWSDATMTQTRMALIRGRICVPGDGNIKLLDIMEVAGIGKRFNGKTLITGVRHRVDQNSWVTDVQFGLSAERFAEQQPAIIDTPAAGLLPAVNGLQVGVVSQFEADPAKEFRVKVVLPGIDKGKEGAVWARVASLDAGNNRGYVFWPEVDDEVIVGFFNDDPRQAVILGAMYSSKNTPPDQVAPLTEENIEKAIVTKTGISIKFIDAEKPALLIETPNSNQIVLDEDAEMIQIIDQHGNDITLNKDGIEMHSTKDIKMEAQGNIEIKGQKVDVK